MPTAILYTSKTGVVKDIAKRLVEESDADVIACDIDNDDIPWNDIDEVVLGAAIYASRTAGRMRRFVRNHESELMQKKCRMFISGAEATVDLARIIANDYSAAFAEHVSDSHYVGGEFRLHNMNFFARLLIKIIASNKKKNATPAPKILDDAVIALASTLGRK